MKVPHELTIEQRDKLAKERGLFSLSILWNQPGYEFYGFAQNGWRFKCHIFQDSKGIHRVGGEAGFNQLIGWKPVEKVAQGERQ